MQVALDPQSRQAVQIWSLDSDIDDSVLELIRSKREVQSATAVVVS
jgi:hypothetical protein